MQIKFKVEASKLNTALGLVSIVPPQPMAQDGAAGYLFVPRAGSDICDVYSRGTNQVATAFFEISDLEGEGSFVYPSQFIESFKSPLVKGPITFTATSEEGAYRVRCATSVTDDDRVSFDPKLMNTGWKDLKEAKAQTPRVFSASLLAEAIKASEPFLPDGTDKNPEEHHKSIQVFGSDDPNLPKANGYIFSSDGTGAFYFYSDAFKDKGMAVPGGHLSGFKSFMSKSPGTLKVYAAPNQNMTFAENDQGYVFGWTRSAAQYTKFSYYNSKMEHVILDLHRDATLARLQFVRACLSKNKNKIRFHYDAARAEIFFTIADEVSKTEGPKLEIHNVRQTDGKDFVSNVDVNAMTKLFTGAKGDTVEFRIMPIEAEGKKTQYMFRTIDEFLYDPVAGAVVGGSGIENVPEGIVACKVTRFVPSRD